MTKPHKNVPAFTDESEAAATPPRPTSDRPEEDQPDLPLAETLDAQDDEAVRHGTEFLKTVVRLKGVRIDREQFLKSELHRRGISPQVIARAVETSPAGAGIRVGLLDDVVSSAIAFETRKSSALSFAAGLPGGFAMLGTVPADVTQYYVHAFRVMQKIAYVYGWQSFLDDVKEVDDETLAKLAGFLGVMMGVGGASASVTAFAAQMAGPAIQKNIAGKALTKTIWYPPLKQTLNLVGVKVTKDSFAKAAAKIVPVAGGVISGGMTFVSLRSQSHRLAAHLREIPPPNVDAAAYLSSLVVEDADAPTGTVRSAVGGAFLSAADAFRSVDLDGDGIPDEARVKTATKEAAAGTRNALRGAAGRLRRSGKAGVEEPEQPKTSPATADERD